MGALKGAVLFLSTDTFSCPLHLHDVLYYFFLFNLFCFFSVHYYFMGCNVRKTSVSYFFSGKAMNYCLQSVI